MEELNCLWSYQESNDELKQKLLYMTYELELARMETNEEIRRNKEHVDQLLYLLQIACQERDEARNQLQNLLNKIIPASPIDQFCKSSLPSTSPKSPLMYPGRANSSFTESNSLSETHNPYSSNSSSPIDSVSSPGLSTINKADSSNLGFLNQPLVQDSNGSSQPSCLFSRGTDKTADQDLNTTGLFSGGNNNQDLNTTGSFSRETNKISHEDFNGSSLPNFRMTPTGGLFSRETNNAVDKDSSIMYNLAKGRPLPKKGKLVQAVMEAGPLLQTLMVAGPLPQWRNPPPLRTFQIPPFSVEDFHCERVDRV
ncbi:hypothetical protein Nepgr_014155 [Nepenthes gracilis]|uniref:Uncharacterized protein n=1 Tax=Nepenthes gracilis TaxID=150966 RepID=A0AAD3XPV8_NEPGR|nr:hypothetical protein Nepgr_014155 [Nepenthes gracilis]